MSLAGAIAVFVIGYLLGRVTLAIAGLAAILALLFAILGLVEPASVTDFLGGILDAYYFGNELLFLSGFLFGVAHDRRNEE